MAQHKLVIAEKPSVAQSWAAVIGATVRKDGYLEGNGWRVSWCCLLYTSITVTTKAGNYFYILIDRANEDKETAVHFLNQVDDADLAALMEDGKTKEEMPAVCSCSTKCEAGAVNTACPVCATDKSKCTGKAPEPPAETSEPEKEKPAGLNPAAIVLLLALLGGGGVFAYLKLVKNKPKTKGNDSLDDYDYGEEDSEEWETEDEESDEPDADGGSTEEDDEDSVK